MSFENPTFGEAGPENTLELMKASFSRELQKIKALVAEGASHEGLVVEISQWVDTNERVLQEREPDTESLLRFQLAVSKLKAAAGFVEAALDDLDDPLGGLMIAISNTLNNPSPQLSAEFLQLANGWYDELREIFTRQTNT